MTLGPQGIVPAPPTWLPVHTLRNATPCLTEITDTGPVANRWGNGFQWEADTCPEATLYDPNCPPGGDQNPVYPGNWEKSDPTSKEVLDQLPFMIETAFSCATNTTVPYAEIAERQLDRILDKSLEWQFWTGAATVGNHPDDTQYLASPDAVIMNADPTVPISGPLALQRIMGGWANCGPGGRAMIHAPAAVVGGWAGDALVDRTYEDGRPYLETRIGQHVVVPGQGYVGTGPNGEIPEPGTAWIYATGPVCVILGPVDLLEDDGRLRRIHGDDNQSRPTNEIIVRAERAAGVYHDDCCVVAALVNVSCCC